MTVNRTPIAFGDGKIVMETEPIEMQHRNHVEKISIDIIDTIRYKVILGIPWLKQHNPTIDWQNGKVDIPQLGGQRNRIYNNRLGKTPIQISTIS